MLNNLFNINHKVYSNLIKSICSHNLADFNLNKHQKSLFRIFFLYQVFFQP